MTTKTKTRKQTIPQPNAECAHPWFDAGGRCGECRVERYTLRPSLPVDISHEDGVRYAVTIRVF